MNSFRKIFFLVLLTGLLNACRSQALGFSVATDLSAQRNFRKDQRFWAIGQTIQAHFHITPKEGVYIWFIYYSNGKFKNNLVANAKSPSTVPQQLDYVNNARMRLKQFSLGWKKYFMGAFDSERNLNAYFFAGFGLLLGRIENDHSISIDTAHYSVPVLSGKANFKRLTIDPGIGIEHSIGGEMYVYGETRLWIPTTNYPSNFLFVNENAPLTVMFNLGMRVLF
jgi:hypothetical protein